MSNFFLIVIVAYKNGPELQETLKALAEQSFTEFNVNILNNNCPLNSTGTICLPDTRFQIINSDENLGFAGGCNKAVENTTAPWLVMLNPDAAPKANWLTEVKKGIQKYNAKMFGSTQIMGRSLELSDGFGDVWSIYGYCWRGGYKQPLGSLPKEDREVLSPCAAASIYCRDFFEKVGGFDETFFCFLEDFDLGLRMRAIGSNCIQLHNARVVHIGGSSLEEQSNYALMQSTKNSARLIIKNAPSVIMPIMILLFFLTQIWFRFRSKDKVQSEYRWLSAKSGLKSWRKHLSSRQETVKMSIWELLRFLDWRKKSLRSLPIKSKPIRGLHKKPH